MSSSFTKYQRQKGDERKRVGYIFMKTKVKLSIELEQCIEENLVLLRLALIMVKKL
jgi:hypothetical protein